MIRANGSIASPRNPARVAAAVPVLVDVVDRFATGSPNPAFRAIVAPRSQRICSIARLAVRPDSPIRIRRRNRSGSGSASGRLRIVKAA